MTHRKRFAILCSAAALIAYLAAAAAVWAALRSAGVVDPAQVGTGALYAALAGMAAAAVMTVLYFDIDRRLLRPAAALSRDVQRIVQSKQMDRSVTVPARHRLGTLPDAVASLVDTLLASRRDMVRAMESATAQVAEQREWLEVILLDLSEGVVVCTPNHQILLYNQAAARLLNAPEALGLGRSLLSLVTREPLVHTLERLDYRRRAGGTGAELSSPFVCATADARAMLQGRMALILGSVREVTGYVISLDDISGEIANLSRMDAVRRALTRGLRGPIANLRAAAETLAGFPDMTPAERSAFESVVLDECTRVSDHVDALAREYRGHALVRWPMADVFAADLFACVARRVAEEDKVVLAPVGIPLWLHGDSYSLTLLFVALLHRLRAYTGADHFDIETLLGDQRVYAEISWQGRAVPSGELETWLDEIPEGAFGDQTIRDALERHGSELWSRDRPQGGAMLRVPLLAPRRPQFQDREAKLPPRPEFYDFGLISEHSSPGALADRPLRELAYVVFDTETTGLRPSEGDEIVSLAGVRVVNGRVLTGERFERLVNPQRPIPRNSVRFHGITDDMVADKPPIHVVLPQFKAFVGDAILVAHNAAFDLKFIRLKEAECGVEFRNSLIDTMVLSVLVDRDEDDHSLDGIADRLGIAVTDRHTAVGDALATAEMLVRLIDRLAAQGIVTLGQVMKASNMAAEMRLRDRRF